MHEAAALTGTARRRGCTHLIVRGRRGLAARRTLKVLRCMLRGIWVTTVDWAGDSLREGRLLPCQGYEVQVRTCLAPPPSVSSATLPPEQSHPSSRTGAAPPFALVRRCQILLAIQPSASGCPET